MELLHVFLCVFFGSDSSVAVSSPGRALSPSRLRHFRAQ